MSDLADFLLARIAEDEAVARYLDRQYRMQFRHTGSGTEYWSNSDYSEEGVSLSGERLLAECEAKRRIIGAYKSAEIDAAYWPNHAPAGERAAQAVARLSAWTYALASLALPYADHPAFQSEWLPSEPDA